MSSPVSGTRTTEKKQRVLVVDDDPDSAEVMSMMLAHYGCDTHIAHAFAAAVEAASQLEPDVALIDIGLPEVDGHQLLTVLRADPALANCRFVAVSGHSRSDLAQWGKDVGFDAYVQKPVGLATLKEAVLGSALVQAGSTG